MGARGLGRGRWRFGPFELDAGAERLLEDGRAVRLPRQSLQALALLVRRSGGVVTREELRAELWPDGTHVDFDTALNSVIRRLRLALGDDVALPRYLATAPGQGYRFIAPLQEGAVATAPAAVVPARVRRRWRWAAALAVVGVLAALAGWRARELTEETPRLVGVRALTRDGGMDLPVRPASDGGVLYYLDRAGGRWNLMRNRGAPTQAEPVAAPFADTRLVAVTRDGEWLLGSFQERGGPMALWRKPAVGGVPVRVGALEAVDAVWSPDGQRVVYSWRDALWTADADGSNARKLAPLPGLVDWLNWSPDGQRLSMTVNGDGWKELWEWRPGQGARRLAWPMPRCCGAWTADGKFFLYSEQRGGVWNLWAQRDAPGLVARLMAWHARPAQLTFGPYDNWGAYTGVAGEVVYYHRQPQTSTALYEPRRGTLAPLLPGRQATQVSATRDGRRLAFTDSGAVWSADGARADSIRQLSPPGMEAQDPRWSPDGSWLAFTGRRGTQPWRVYRVAASGGAAQPVAAAGVAATMALEDPDWSPDGRLVLTEVNADRGGGPDTALAIAAGGHLLEIAGSRGLASARWSPDGHWLAAYSEDQRRLLVYSFAQGRWRQVASGDAVGTPSWSRDSRDLYYQQLLAPGQPLERLVAGTWQQEQVADFGAVLHNGVHRCGFMGLGPQDEPMLLLTRGSSDLYAAQLRLP